MTNKKQQPKKAPEKTLEKDIDKISGVETTGHDWDGLKELNNPLPRWWVWVWLVTIIWSVWYFFVYPSWPTLTGATEGTSGYTQYKELKESQDEIELRQQAYLKRFEAASFEDILNDPELYAFASAGGRTAFMDNCATCHGTGATGAKGYPNLQDDDWMWGGSIEEIYTTLRHGIRWDADADTHVSQMPAYGKDGILTKEQIKSVAHYVMSLSDETVHADEVGASIFMENCAMCHGEDGRGMASVGAPNLADAIWLYGGDEHTIYESIYYARAGVMPAWHERLDENTLRQLSVYVHELGGGK